MNQDDCREGWGGQHASDRRHARGQELGMTTMRIDDGRTVGERFTAFELVTQSS